MYSLFLVDKKSRYNLIYPLQNLTSDLLFQLKQFLIDVTVVARLSILILTTNFSVGLSKLFSWTKELTLMLLHRVNNIKMVLSNEAGKVLLRYPVIG